MQWKVKINHKDMQQEIAKVIVTLKPYLTNKRNGNIFRRMRPTLRRN
jgi:hypothetical protein